MRRPGFDSSEMRLEVDGGEFALLVRVIVDTLGQLMVRTTAPLVSTWIKAIHNERADPVLVRAMISEAIVTGILQGLLEYRQTLCKPENGDGNRQTVDHAKGITLDVIARHGYPPSDAGISGNHPLH